MIEKSSVLNLLEESFPGITANIARCERVGFPWKSKPLLKEVKGEIVSHVGILDYPVLVHGQEVAMCALHAICTKEAHRGQGFASEIIQEALSWAKERSECMVLFTEIPKFYEKLSFRTLQEQRFHLRCPHPKGSQPLFPLTSPQDDALFIRCFRERSAVSGCFWVQDKGQIASFNTLFATYPTYWSLYYSPAFDGILSFIVKDKALHLFDIIARRLPTLDMILDHLPSAIDEIYFYFSPDLITHSTSCKPLVCDNSMADFSGYLMVHGNWPEIRSFMITPLSRC